MLWNLKVYLYFFYVLENSRYLISYLKKPPLLNIFTLSRKKKATLRQKLPEMRII